MRAAVYHHYLFITTFIKRNLRPAAEFLMSNKITFTLVYQSLINTSQFSESSSKSSKSSSSLKEKHTPSYDEIARYKEFYTTPVSGPLDPETYSKYQTMRSMVVSQTWLTGWIKELYNIESDIVSATGKSL